MVTTVPRLLRLDSKLHLMSARVSFGKVLELAGPYQCVSGAGDDPASMLQGLITEFQRACEAAVVELSDLDPALQERVTRGFGIAQAPQVDETVDLPAPVSLAETLSV